MTVTASCCWKLHDQTAEFESGPLSFRIDVQKLSDGLQAVCYDGRSLDGLSPLRLTASPPLPNSQESLAECYLRGRDLVTRYHQVPPRTSQPEIYWRGLESQSNGEGVEVWASMQTSLLVSDPTLIVSSQVPARQWCVWSDKQQDWQDSTSRNGEHETSCGTLFLFRLDDRDVSYVEMILPADFAGGGVRRTGGGAELRYELFPESLEKGVIRRARMLSIVVPRQGDQAAARSCFEDFLSQSPPLTT